MKKVDGVFAHPARIPPNGVATVSAWFKGRPTLGQSRKILIFGGAVRGVLSLFPDGQGATNVEWRIKVEDPEQAKAAAETLAKMILIVVGIRLVGYRLADNTAVERSIVTAGTK